MNECELILETEQWGDVRLVVSVDNYISVPPDYTTWSSDIDYYGYTEFDLKILRTNVKGILDSLCDEDMEVYIEELHRRGRQYVSEFDVDLLTEGEYSNLRAMAEEFFLEEQEELSF